MSITWIIIFNVVIIVLTAIITGYLAWVIYSTCVYANSSNPFSINQSWALFGVGIVASVICIIIILITIVMMFLIWRYSSSQKSYAGIPIVTSKNAYANGTCANANVTTVNKTPTTIPNSDRNEELELAYKMEEEGKQEQDLGIQQFFNGRKLANIVLNK